ncbi:MAG: hypothetical protein A2Y79_12480 [Deltaproteobacteria bacterium RBG_13_43_22]|nr:MAG: hypothetical protein A2Y79_12480 [Deltaproteobacteria bacterium RBG_13_43_22]
MSPFARWIGILFVFAGVLVTIIYLFSIGVTLWGEFVIQTAYLHLILALFLPPVFLYFPANARAKQKVPWYDYALAAVCFIAPFYYFLHGMDIMYESWEVSPPTLAYYFGIIFWALVLESVRRSVGWVLFVLVLAFSLYPLFAENMPSLFFAKSFGFYRTVGYHAMGPEGMIGLPTRVLGTLFAGFLFFGVALTATGAAKFFLDTSLALLGTVRGGTAKVAVISSAMVGSISGSVITNVITTGSFTIPAMKRAGYPNHYAGAIETCASTGGVLMPPIMGAAAFVMASILEIPYSHVVLAAIIPSLLYYFGLFVQVDGYAAKTGLKGLPRDELPSFWQALNKGWFYMFAFVILIYFLFFKRLEAQAPFIASVALLMLSQIRKETRFNWRTFVDFLEKTSRVISEIAGILAAIGLLIGSLLLTGMAQTLSSSLIELARGNLYLLVAFGAIASFILGMGLTITACYLLLAVLLAPALEQLGLYIVGVHLFLMYCGMLSFITPPVAIAAYAAASLAGASPMKTGFQACRMGIILFVLPFFFVFNPAFVLHGSTTEIINVVGTGFLGVALLSSGVEGYLVIVGLLHGIRRLLCIAAGVLLLMPGMTTNIVGVILALIVIMGKFFTKTPESIEVET